jgi:hypothetical protein
MVTAAQAQRAVVRVARTCVEAVDESTLLAGVAARLRPLLDYDASVWLTTDPTPSGCGSLAPHDLRGHRDGLRRATVRDRRGCSVRR